MKIRTLSLVVCTLSGLHKKNNNKYKMVDIIIKYRYTDPCNNTIISNELSKKKLVRNGY